MESNKRDSVEASSSSDTADLSKCKEKIPPLEPNSKNVVPVPNTGGTPPPPYTEKSERPSSANDRKRSSATSIGTTKSNMVASTGYTVPKDLKEGLPNPVFSYSTNNSDDESDPQNNGQHKTAVTNLQSSNQQDTISNIPSFESLASYDQYTSHTTLYANSNTVDYDAEKGPSESSSGPSKHEKKDEKDNSKGSGGSKEYTGIKKYLGLLLTLSASFSFSLVILFVKVLKDYGFDAFGASFWRYSGTVIPTIPLIFFYECGPGVKKQASIFTTVWPVLKNENWKTWLGLLSRGLIGSTSVILRYYALEYLSIGDTSVITYSTPVLVTVLAHFFLGERCGVFPVIVAFLTLFGVVIVTKPPIITGATEFDTRTMIGSGFACGSLFCSALIVIITRKIREVHFTVMTFVFGIIGVLQALTLIYFLGHFNLPTELYDSLLVGGVASLSFLGQMAIILALKFEQAGPVALIRSCDVIFGFLLQYIFLNVVPDIYSAIGAVIVLTGVLSTGFRKWLNTLPGDDRQRKIWWFVLR